MSDQRSWFKRFVEDFGKVPEGEPTQLIPDEIRVPVFLGIVVASIVLLALFLWFVVIPGIRAQQPASVRPAQASCSRSSLGAESPSKEIV